MVDKVAGQEVESRVSLDVRPFKDGVTQAAAAAERMRQDMRSALDSVSLQFLGLKSAVESAVAGIKFSFNAVIKGAINFADESRKAAQRAGVTTEQFTGMAYAAKLADVGVGELTRTYARLNAILNDAKSDQKEAAELFRRLQFDPKSFKDADALLLALADRFASMTDEGKKTALAIDMLGERFGPGLLPFLNQGRAGIEDLRAEAERLGLVLSAETGQAAEQFNDTLTQINAQMQGVQMTLAKELLPSLLNLVTATRDYAVVGQAASAVAAAIRTTFEAVAVAGANVAFTLQGIGREMGAIGAQIAALMRGDFTGFKAISEAVKADGERARAELDLFERRILRLGGPGTRESEDRGFIPNSPVPTGGWEPGGKGAKDGKGAKGANAEKSPSMMAYYEAALDEEKRLATERDALHGMSKQAELQFWQDLLSYATLSEADRMAVMKRASAARIAVLQQEARDAQQIGAVELGAWEKRALAMVDADADAAKLRVDLGQSTQAELLGQESDFEVRRFAIRRAALTQKLASLDPERDPVQVAQTNAQIEELELQHQQRLSQIRGQVAVESSLQLRAIWDDAISRINGLWDKGVDAMMQGTLTWRNAFRAIGMEITGWFAKAVVGNMVKDWLLGQSKKLQASLAGWAAEQAAAIAGTAATKSAKVAEATTVINANAGEAASGAASSQASIPIVGPALAAGAFAAVGAMVLGAMSMLKSAAGGYDVPAGINPLTQLHQREMVLPAKYADVIRGMAGNGGGTNDGGDTAPVHIHTSGGDFVHKRDLAKLLTQMKRNFAFVDR